MPMVEEGRKRGRHPDAAAAAGRVPDIGHSSMPKMSSPIRTRLRRPPAILIASSLLTSAVLGGCAGGDFGRTRESFRSDDMHRWIGVEATGSVGLRASQYQLTDNERLLRDLAYPLIEPPHSRPAWKTVFGDYLPLPAPWRQAPPFDRTEIGRAHV